MLKHYIAIQTSHMSHPSTTIRPFTDAKPLSIRIWHWATALFFSVSIITVSINEFILDGRTQIQAVNNAAKEKGVTLDRDQTRAIVRTFREPIWELHKYAGFGISILLLWRMFIEFRSGKNNRLASKLKAAFNRRQKVEGTALEQNHFSLVQAGYLVFYVLIVLMACTGLILAFEEVPFFKSIHDPAKETHELLQWAFYTYAVIHIGGVVWSDSKLYNGLVSRMIHGKQ